MTRAAFPFVVGGMLLSVLAAVTWVRTRPPQRAVGSAGDTVFGEREADAQPGAPLPFDRDEPTAARDNRAAAEPEPRDAGAVSPNIALPRIVEELRLRYPFYGPLVERYEYQLASEGRHALQSPAMEARILSEISQKALSLEFVDLHADCKTTQRLLRRPRPRL